MRDLDKQVDLAYKVIDKIDDAALGKIIKDHLSGTIYDLGYEGYSLRDRAGVKKFIIDLALSADATANTPSKIKTDAGFNITGIID